MPRLDARGVGPPPKGFNVTGTFSGHFGRGKQQAVSQGIEKSHIGAWRSLVAHWHGGLHSMTDPLGNPRFSEGVFLCVGGRYWAGVRFLWINIDDVDERRPPQGRTVKHVHRKVNPRLCAIPLSWAITIQVSEDKPVNVKEIGFTVQKESN
jgi:hypothetical protein